MPIRRTRFFIVALLTLLLVACSTPPDEDNNSNEPAILLNASAGSVPVGQTLKISVQVENISDLIAAEAHLSFDPDLLEVVSIEHGTFLQPDFIAQDSFDNTIGTLDYAIAQINRPAAQGSGTLFIVELRTRAAGTAWVQFRATPAVPLGALLANADGQALPATLADTTISITP